MDLHESSEMYLETIYVLSKKSDIVRSIDVSEYMGYSKPSIHRAVYRLHRNGLLEIDENGHLFLTDKGSDIAKNIYEKHTVLTDILIKIGVSSETAEKDACKIEHVLSDETFMKLKQAFNIADSSNKSI